MFSSKKIAVIMTVFNRKEITLAGLRKLYQSFARVNNVEFDVFLTDDGCTDGTYEAVKSEFPKLIVINGNGSLYWSGGMRKAWSHALKYSDYDYFLWFNDDAMLYDNAISELIKSSYELGDDFIISGAFKDRYGNVSYGGADLNCKLIEPDGSYKNIYYMNGNLVLIPRKIVDVIGIIDNFYTHSLGDWDYGLTALENGFNVVLTRDFVGETDRHDNVKPKFRCIEYSLFIRLKSLYSKREQVFGICYFKAKHYGILNGIKLFFKMNIDTVFCSKYE